MSRVPPPLGRWAVATGASSGIGAALAAELAARGHHLVLVARREAQLRAVAAPLEARGISVHLVTADLATAAGRATLEAVTAALDVDVFVANAGFGTSGPFLDADAEREVAMLELNCRALLLQTHAYARRFAARQRGTIILVSSMLARQGTPWTAHYAATKAYVTALGEALAVELAEQGVAVLVAEPGPTASEFAAVAGMRLGATMTSAAVARSIVGRLGGRGRFLAGWLPALLVGSQAMLPRALRVRLMGTIMRGMAAH